MHYLFALLAQNTQEAPGKGAGDSIFSNPMLPFLLIAVVFMIFMVVLPERKRRKDQKAMMSSLKVKDKVIIAGGIIGMISNISDKEDEVTIRLEEGKMKVQKSSILRVFSSVDEAATQDAIKKI